MSILLCHAASHQNQLKNQWLLSRRSPKLQSSALCVGNTASKIHWQSGQESKAQHRQTDICMSVHMYVCLCRTDKTCAEQTSRVYRGCGWHPAGRGRRVAAPGPLARGEQKQVLLLLALAGYQWWSELHHCSQGGKGEEFLPAKFLPLSSVIAAWCEEWEVKFSLIA